MDEEQQLVGKSPEELSGRIRVMVRLKPIQLDSQGSEQSNWAVPDQKHLYNRRLHERHGFGTNSSSQNQDNVFDECISTEDLFHQSIKPLISSAMLGHNFTLFAFGQTSSGKTYTIQGSEASKGIVPLSLEEVFREVGKLGSHVEGRLLVKVSYLELYNEAVNDLLDANKKNLDVLYAPNKDVYIRGLTQAEVKTAEQALELIRRGDKEKKIAPTKMNDQSSRSHTLLTLSVEFLATGEVVPRKISKINLVDLAGSEDIKNLNLAGKSVPESVNINKSLFELSNVIEKLSKRNLKGTAAATTTTAEGFINFRNSKLTRMLQSALSSGSITAIICTISQAPTNEAESIRTLQFGHKASNVVIQKLPSQLKGPEAELQLNIFKLNALINQNQQLREQLLEKDGQIEQLKMEKAELISKRHEFQNFDCIQKEFKDLIGTIDLKNEEIFKQKQRMEQLETVLRETIEKYKIQRSEYKDRNLMVLNLQEQLMQLEICYKQKNEELKSMGKDYHEVYERLYKYEQQDKQVAKVDKSICIGDSFVGVENQESQEVSFQDKCFSTYEEKQSVKGTRIQQYQMEEKFGNLKAEYENLNQQHKKSVRELETKILHLEHKLQREELNKQHVLKEIKKMKDDFKVQEQALSNKDIKIQRLMAELGIQEEVNRSLFHELDQSLVNVSSIQAKNDLDNTSYMAEYMEIQTPTRNYDLSFQDQRRQSSTRAIEMLRQKETIMKENQELKNQIKDLQIQLEECQGQLQDVCKKVVSIDGDQNNLIYEKEEMEDKLIHVERELYDAIQDLYQREYEISQMVQEIDEQVDRINQLENKLSEKEATSLTREMQLKESEDKVKQQEDILQKMKSELQEKTVSLARMDALLNQKEIENQQLSIKYQELQQSLKKRKADFDEPDMVKRVRRSSNLVFLEGRHKGQMNGGFIGSNTKNIGGTVVIEKNAPVQNNDFQRQNTYNQDKEEKKAFQ